MVLLSIQPGGPERLELHHLPAPKPGPGELRVRALACAINHPDVLVIEDKYQFKPATMTAAGFARQMFVLAAMPPYSTPASGSGAGW